jgi:putative ABC transport system permease protein
VEPAVIHSPAALWHERQRFLPAVLAVAFSALLIILQAGLLLGFFSLKSIPIDQAPADLWIAHPAVQSVDLGRPIPEKWTERVASQPEVVRTEPYIMRFVVLHKPDGESEQCLVIGSRLDDEALGAIRELSSPLRERLTEPGSVVADESDLGEFGRGGREDVGEAAGRQVRLVGRVHGVKGLGAAYLFCSLQTARRLTPELREDEVTFLLARCRNPRDAAAVARRLRTQYDMAVFTREEFSSSTRLYWLTKTQAGIATAWTAVLGLVIGTVITSQILYAATASYRREYAVLRALGIPRWRMTLAVLEGAFWVGCAGVGLAALGAFGMVRVADALGIKVLLTPPLLGLGTAVTMVMAFLSSLAALRAQRRIEPAELLR